MIQKTKKLNVAAQKQIKQVKIMITGDCATGKSTFCTRYCTGKLLQGYEPTLGVETHHKHLERPNGSLTNITLWDFSGKLEFLDIRNQFYKETHMLLIFCDLASKNTTQALSSWAKQGRDHGANNITVVGNKSDNKKSSEAEDFARAKDFDYHELCSREGEQVDSVMAKVLSQTLKKM